MDDEFVFPQYSGFEYAQTAQLLDLCTLDVCIANFPYFVIAAAAISYTFNKKTAVKLSAFEKATIAPCYRWIEPYFHVIMHQPKLCSQERNIFRIFIIVVFIASCEQRIFICNFFYENAFNTFHRHMPPKYTKTILHTKANTYTKFFLANTTQLIGVVFTVIFLPIASEDTINFFRRIPKKNYI